MPDGGYRRIYGVALAIAPADQAGDRARAAFDEVKERMTGFRLLRLESVVTDTELGFRP